MCVSTVVSSVSGFVCGMSRRPLTVAHPTDLCDLIQGAPATLVPQSVLGPRLFQDLGTCCLVQTSTAVCGGALSLLLGHREGFSDLYTQSNPLTLDLSFTKLCFISFKTITALGNPAFNNLLTFVSCIQNFKFHGAIGHWVAYTSLCP